jgi:hypothetical protein
LVNYSITILAGLGALVLAALACGGWGTKDELGRITAISISHSVAYIPYFFALWWAGRTEDSAQLWRVGWAVAIALRTLGFLYPAALSDDLLRYEWEAGVLAQGMSPYRNTPAALGAANLRMPGYDVPAVYGPVIQLVQWVFGVTGLPLKLLGGMGEGLFMWVASRQGWPVWRWLMVAWCPLSVVECWGNGHNDGWVMLLLGLALGRDGLGSWAWLGLAALTKWWPLWLAPVWWRGERKWAGLALMLGLLASCGLWLSVGEWVERVRFGTGFLGGWTNNAFLFELLGSKERVAAAVTALSLGLAWQGASRGMGALALATVLLGFSANVHPWYLTWLLPALGVTGVNPLPWLLAMSLSSLLYDPMYGWTRLGSWVEDAGLRYLVWGAVFSFSIFKIIGNVESKRVE